MKKVNIFCHSFQKVKPIYYYRFITHRVKHFKPLFLEILMVKMVHLYTLNTWLGLILHEVLHQSGMAWRQSVCGTSQV